MHPDLVRAPRVQDGLDQCQLGALSILLRRK